MLYFKQRYIATNLKVNAYSLLKTACANVGVKETYNYTTKLLLIGIIFHFYFELKYKKRIRYMWDKIAKFLYAHTPKPTTQIVLCELKKNQTEHFLLY